MLKILLRFLRHENPELEALKKRAYEEREQVRQHVRRLKAELEALNGGKRAGRA